MKTTIFHLMRYWLFCAAALLMSGVTVAHARYWELDRYESSSEAVTEDVYIGSNYTPDGEESKYLKTHKHETAPVQIHPISVEARGLYPYTPAVTSGAAAWHTGRTAQQKVGREGGGPSAPPARAHVTYTVHAVYKWRGSSNELPSDFIYVRENAFVWGQVATHQRDSWPIAKYNAGNPFEDQCFQFSGISNDFGDDFVLQQRYPSATQYQSSAYYAGASHVTKIASKGGSVVQGPSRVLQGTVTMNTAYTEEQSDALGSAVVSVGYGAETLPFSIHADVFRGRLLVIQPTYQEWNAYAKQDYHLNDPGAALMPFWSGAGSYSVVAHDKEGKDFFPAQTYQWLSDGDGQVYIPEPHDESEADTYLLEASQSSKSLNFDLGSSSAGFPKSSTVRVLVTGADERTGVLAAKAVVHWYLPRWFVYKEPRVVTTVTGAADPDKDTGPINPDDNPDNNEYAPMQTAKAYTQAQQDFIHTGATYIKTILEIEVEIAKLPFYELGGAALEGVLVKAGELLEKANELRAFALKARETAIEAKRLAQEGRQLGKSAEDVAQQEVLVAEAEEAAVKAEQEAISAEQKATQASQDVETVQSARKADVEPSNLTEQLTMDEAKAGSPDEKIVMGEGTAQPLGDTPRLDAGYGPGRWVKMEHVHRGQDVLGNPQNTVIHWFRNLDTGVNCEFKFK